MKELVRWSSTRALDRNTVRGDSRSERLVSSGALLDERCHRGALDPVLTLTTLASQGESLPLLWPLAAATAAEEGSDTAVDPPIVNNPFNRPSDFVDFDRLPTNCGRVVYSFWPFPIT